MSRQMKTRPPGDALAEIEAAFGPLAGRRLLDIGCGPGRLIDALARRGAVMAGIDPEPGTVARARGLVPGADIRQAGAEALPFAAGAFDGAVFLNSLHHVPAPLMGAALAEALRVVGSQGSVVVIEPLPEGSFFEAMRPLEDETEVRLAAQEALAALASSPGVELLGSGEWDRSERFATLDQFVERVLAADPARAGRLDAAYPALAAGFERWSEPGPRGHVLHQTLRMHRFRPAEAGIS